MLKKGVIELQFNWTFILIIGVIILAFFSAVAIRSKFISDVSIAETILTHMRTIMTGAEVSMNTITKVTLPNKEITLHCDEFVVGDVRRSIPQNRIFFSSATIPGREMLTWTLPWSMPYHVTNFIYLSSPTIQYIFVASEDDEYAAKVYSLIPSEINKRMLTPSELLTELYDTGGLIKIVFFTEDAEYTNLPNSLSSSDRVSAISLNPDTHEVVFYVPKGIKLEEVGRSFFIGKEMMIGAIFTERFEDYECSINKAFRKLNIISKLYEIRTQSIMEQSLPGCRAYYPLDLIRGLQADIKPENRESVIETVQEIKRYNEYLRSLSCPTIY